MVYKNRRTSLQVTTGSGNPVHNIVNDGKLVLGKAGNNALIEISSSVELGDRQNGNSLSNSGLISSGMFRMPMYNSGSEDDITLLNALAASPSNYNGYMFYMSSSNGLKKNMIVGFLLKRR